MRTATVMVWTGCGVIWRLRRYIVLYSVEERGNEHVTRWTWLGKKRLWPNRVVQNMSEEQSKTTKHSGQLVFGLAFEKEALRIQYEVFWPHKMSQRCKTHLRNVQGHNLSLWAVQTCAYSCFSLRYNFDTSQRKGCSSDCISFLLLLLICNIVCSTSLPSKKFSSSYYAYGGRVCFYVSYSVTLKGCTS